MQLYGPSLAMTEDQDPTGQFVHEALPAAEDHEPGRQFMQEVAPEGNHCPAAHNVHEKAPAEAETNPAGQFEHLVPSKNVPAKHVLIEQAGPVISEELQTQTP